MAMKFKDIAEQYGLTYLPRTKELPWDTAVGNYRGYEVNYLVVNGNPVQHIVTFSAKPGETPPTETPAAFMTRLAQEQKKIVIAATAQGLTFKVILKPATFKKLAENLGVVLDQVTGYFSANHFVSCCDRCGTTDERHLCAVSDMGCRILCPECEVQTVADLESQKTAVKSKKGNLVTGLVGAFLGSLIGVVVWVLIYQLGYIAALGGLVMVICVLKGYELFGGKLHIGGVITCIVLSLVMLFLAHYSCYTFEVYKIFSVEYEVSFFDCFKALPEFFKESSELMAEFIGELVIGYLLLGVGGFSAIYSAYRKSNPNGKVVRVG